MNQYDHDPGDSPYVDTSHGQPELACTCGWNEKDGVPWVRHTPRRDPDNPPVIDGCQVVNRGDGHYSCKRHFRYWPIGSGICPGRNQ